MLVQESGTVEAGYIFNERIHDVCLFDLPKSRTS